MTDKILKFAEKIEKVIITTLLFSLLAVVLYATVVFVVILFTGIFSNIENAFSDDNVLTYLHLIFQGFMIILIGVELIHTIKIYLKEDVVHVEVVLLVALIGISRHVIDLDYKHLEPMTLVGISSLILVLSAGYYLIKMGIRIKRDPAADRLPEKDKNSA